MERRSLGIPGPAAFGLAVFVLALWAQTRAMVGVFYDDGIYATGARALAEGYGYRNIHLPAAPPMVHYPVLYPALLALLWRAWPAFPANVALFQLLDSAALGAAAWLIAGHARRLDLGGPARYAALALGFTAFPLLALIGVRFAEPLFLALAAGAVGVSDKDDVSPRAAAAAGVLAGLAALARSIGVGVVAAVPVALWLRHRRREAVIAAAAGMLIALPWAVWVSLQAGKIDPRLTNYTAYGQVVGQTGVGPLLTGLFTLRALRPVTDLLLNLWRGLLPAWGFTALAVLFSGVLVLGGVAAFRRAPSLVVTLAAYLLITTMWPFAPDRFIWTVMPWLCLLLVFAGAYLWRRGTWGRGAVLAMVVAVAVGYARPEALSLLQRRFARPAERITEPFRVLSASIAAETPANAVVASEDEALIFLYTGRRAVPSNLFRWQGIGTAPIPPDSVVRYWCEAGVTHLAVSGPGDLAGPLAARLAARPDSAAVPLFRVTNGPALYRFRCPR
jgi:hypothetical protein